MQNRQSGRRRRGGGGGSGNNPRPMGMAAGGQNAARLEVRVRGNAHQLLEKYKQLARDAHQAGDRVAALSSRLSNSAIPEAARVASGPGETAWTRMFCGPSSEAM